MVPVVLPPPTADGHESKQKNNLLEIIQPGRLRPRAILRPLSPKYVAEGPH